MSREVRTVAGVAVLALSATLAIASCKGEDNAKTEAAPEVTSRHPNVLAKNGEVLHRDLAAALELPREEVCRELGLYDCAKTAHRIVLGGTEPYGLRVDEPLPVAPVTAPIAVDRVALQACGRRVAKDFDAPTEARVFGPLARREANGRDAAVTALYARLLAREPEPRERELVLRLGDAPATDREFAVLACFTVSTTLEFLFF